uniref:Potassium transporter 5 n=1 Tax=Anthurium amnicola TaxID=1678845 RepID=A0A1D1XD80_9ARAE
MISGAFAIISQSLALGCFPRVKVVHTSAEYEGQVYIPEINYILMVACVIVTAAFKTTEKIGNAYGIAVVTVMLITTCMLTLIMLVIWKTSIWWAVLFFVIFGGIESVYISSALYKFAQGGFLPLLFSFVMMCVMGIWHYVHKEKYLFELNNKVSSGYMRELALNPDISRLPGMGLFYSELVQGIPPIFPHFIENVPSIHSVLLFVSIKHLPISHVVLEERFLFRVVEPRECRMFRCVVRYGYKDSFEDPEQFERLLVRHLKEFIHPGSFTLEGAPLEERGDARPPRRSGHATVHTEENLHPRISSGSIQRDSSNLSIQRIDEEKQFIQKAMEKGVVYLLGEAQVLAQQNSSLFKKVVVNYLYDFLRRNFRQGTEVMPVPRGRLLKVGMTYEI